MRASTRERVSLIVQPGDSFFPIVEAIDGARRAINITIFRMDDPIILNALLDAAKRGVRVRALVAANPRGWQKKNRKLLKELTKAGIETKHPTADSPKSRFHYKLLTVDSGLCLVLTFNPTRENLHYTRDYGIVMRDDAVVAELDRLFEADWTDTDFTPDPASPLVISPYNSRAKIAELLNSATKSIHISDAKLRDFQILNILMAKATAGIDVRILGRDKYYSEVFSLLKMRQITRFKLHAKCVVVDSARAFVGSMNLRYESMEKRREVGVIVDDAKVTAKLEAIFKSDWQQRPRMEAAATTMTLDSPTIISPVVTPTAPLPERFLLLSRKDALSRVALREGATAIGRAEDNDVVVLEPPVSRYHARVLVRDGKVSVTDLNSQNGTFVNGEQISGTVPLSAGDVLAIADGDEFRLVEL